ncbi:DNA-processing protein DprA [Actinoallomurus sp. CA-150999]|uniref:DNA-processing protein DprA n=1 Tax=Actinoallomurus sp. CA-150999 TaxID=3239887 RepID=UPI003D8ADB8B
MDGAMHGERAALVALLRARPGGMSWSEITADVLEAGSALQVWDATVPATLMALPGEDDPLGSAAEDIGRWASQGHRLLTILDAEYPSRLRGIHQAPPVLFARGTLLPDEVAVSVVGSRQASDRGLRIAAHLAQELAARNVTVLAGLALGIDTAAHRAALDADGRTVAVIGTGINKTYPAANRALHEEIASHGLLLSQFWPDAPPQKSNFPMRNATMSGYGIATVVVEAGEQSGARIQARLAVEHGRPVILTELVVERNDWAKALVGRPGVHVAERPSAVLSVIEELITEGARVDAELLRLVSAQT